MAKANTNLIENKNKTRYISFEHDNTLHITFIKKKQRKQESKSKYQNKKRKHLTGYLLYNKTHLHTLTHKLLHSNIMNNDNSQDRQTNKQMEK